MSQCRRSFVTSAAAMAAVMTTAGAQVFASSAGSANFVLVHGACHDDHQSATGCGRGVFLRLASLCKRRVSKSVPTCLPTDYGYRRRMTAIGQKQPRDCGPRSVSDNTQDAVCCISR